MTTRRSTISSTRCNRFGPASTSRPPPSRDLARGGGRMRPQPLIAVADVAASSRWYCALLAASSGHGGREYERIVQGDRIILQLHDWHAHDHPNLGDPDAGAHGYGVLIWFEIDDFDAAVARAR